MIFLAYNLEEVQIWGAIDTKSPSIVIYLFMWNKVDQHLNLEKQKRGTK